MTTHPAYRTDRSRELTPAHGLYIRTTRVGHPLIKKCLPFLYTRSLAWKRFLNNTQAQSSRFLCASLGALLARGALWSMPFADSQFATGGRSMSRLMTRALVGACVWLVPALAAAQAPDRILYNGKILTVDSKFSIASALAIRGERIVAVATRPRSAGWWVRRRCRRISPDARSSRG